MFRTWIQRPNFAALLWLAWSIVVVQLLVQHWPETARTLYDTDDAMRLVQMRAWLAGQGWFDLHQARLQPPTGYNSHWSRLVDAGLAGLLWLFSIFAEPALAERMMRATWPLLWVLPTLVGMVAIAWRLAGREAAIVALFVRGRRRAGLSPIRSRPRRPSQCADRAHHARGRSDGLVGPAALVRDRGGGVDRIGIGGRLRMPSLCCGLCRSFGVALRAGSPARRADFALIFSVFLVSIFDRLSYQCRARSLDSQPVRRACLQQRRCDCRRCAGAGSGRQLGRRPRIDARHGRGRGRCRLPFDPCSDRTALSRRTLRDGRPGDLADLAWRRAREPADAAGLCGRIRSRPLPSLRFRWQRSSLLSPWRACANGVTILRFLLSPQRLSSPS